MNMLNHAIILTAGFTDTDMLREYVDERSVILHEIEGRIQFKMGGDDCNAASLSKYSGKTLNCPSFPLVLYCIYGIAIADESIA